MENIRTYARSIGETSNLLNASDFMAILLKGFYKHKLNTKYKEDSVPATALWVYNHIDPKDDMFKKLTKELFIHSLCSVYGIKDVIGEDGKNIFEDDLKNTKEEKGIYLDHEIELLELFDKSVTEVTDLYDQMSDFVLNGDLIDKDRRYPTVYFMIHCIDRMLASIAIDLDRSIRYGVQYTDDETRQGLWKKYQRRLNKKIKAFKGEGPIYEYRQMISDACYKFAKNGNGVYVLSAPTGSGKTLSSMRYAVELAKKEKKKHIYYTAPYLSIIEQNATEIEGIFQDDDNVIEHHTNASVSKNDDSKLTETWDSPVVLTTMVQMLNTMCHGRTGCIRRFHQLCNSVVIIDEVQTLPVETITAFNNIVNFLSITMNTTFVLCTATQPALDYAKNPICYSSPREMVPEVHTFKELFERVKIVNTIKSGFMSLHDVTTFINKHFDQNMLVVLNTVGGVSELCHELRATLSDGIKLIELTGNMCPANRLDMINQMKQQLVEGERILCVSTRLIEAGVDISFKTAIRAVCGLDSINQTCGRCNRSGEYDEGTLYIINPAFEEDKIKPLPDILYGKSVAVDILMKEPEDILSEDVVRKYYEGFYERRKNSMDYKISKLKTTQFELLSTNPVMRREFEDRYGVDIDAVIAFSSRIAGMNYQIINEKGMRRYVVPYGEANDILRGLVFAKSDRERTRCMRMLQRYSVTVYNGKERMVAANEFSVNGITIPVINDKYYNPEKGGLMYEKGEDDERDEDKADKA